MTKVKICGICNLEDAQVAAEAGADLLGFVFYPPSPRYVTPEQVRQIVKRSRAFNLYYVGVFVDQPPDVVDQTLNFCGLDYAQLHGAEPPEAVDRLIGRGYGVIKAFRVRDERSLPEIASYRATAYLLDTYVPGQPGGTGHRFDWSLVEPVKEHGPVILAGGLTPDNVTQALHTAQPWGVDVSSGVEATPRRKDPELVRCFIAAAKRGERKR